MCITQLSFNIFVDFFPHCVGHTKYHLFIWPIKLFNLTVLKYVTYTVIVKLSTFFIHEKYGIYNVQKYI